MFDESPNVDVHAPEVIAPIPDAVARNSWYNWFTFSILQFDQDAPHQVLGTSPVPPPDKAFVISLSGSLDFSKSQEGFFINQSKYALESLKKYGYESCDPVDTPMVEKSKLDEDKGGTAVDPSHYRGMIGTLLYLTARTFIGGSLVIEGFFTFALTAFADADHAGCQDTRRSTSGTHGTLNSGSDLALDDALVDPVTTQEWKCNLSLGSDISSKEATPSRCWASVMFTIVGPIQDDKKNETTQLYGAILPVALTNEDIRNSESYKEYYAMASGTIPPKTKGSKKKANTDAIPKLKPPTAPKKKKSGTGKQKTSELENISEADLTEAEQLKIVIKRSRQETHSSHASGSGADEGTGVKPGVPDAHDYDSEDDISWKSSDDDQDDEQDQDDDDAEKHDVNETTQEEEDDDDHDNDENDQEDDDAHDDDKKADDDDDEELTESDNDGDDFVHPKLTTHDDEIIHEEDTEEDDSSISSSDEEDSDNDVEGANVAGAKSDKDATDAKDQGNEAVKDTNTDLDGRDKVMTDVEDTHVTLTPVNPDGQQQSSSVSSGFVSNMLNPNQDTGVDDIFRQHTEATSLIDTSVTAIMEPSFTAQINRPPTPHPIVIQTQQPPIMTPATSTSSLLENLPNFASLFGFDHRLKALEDNFSELRQTNQYAEALSSIPGTV
ncbi:retrovirus-related pol polyprotein from transposon TNT 1-94 [Tanacetum coccineum]|uniref:Retrovirus-related pol polyprotein from transposon TNT 1-94 n=1 Tax=Tanacetum coccineum TaxID=301880 RepID=A0ABQ5GUH9_9ASTR